MERYDRSIEQLIEVCHQAYISGLQKTNGGNVSIRTGENQMLIKARGAAFREAGSKDFVLADFDGHKQMGTSEPSKESLLHGAVYKNRQEIQAIVHVHAPCAIAWSEEHTCLRRETWQSRLKMTGDIPVWNVDSPVVRKEDLPELKRMMEAGMIDRAFILRNHGIVALGESMEEAVRTAELVEETAQIAILKEMCRGAGKESWDEEAAV